MRNGENDMRRLELDNTTKLVDVVVEWTLFKCWDVVVYGGVWWCGVCMMINYFLTFCFCFCVCLFYFSFFFFSFSFHFLVFKLFNFWERDFLDYFFARIKFHRLVFKCKISFLTDLDANCFYGVGRMHGRCDVCQCLFKFSRYKNNQKRRPWTEYTINLVAMAMWMVVLYCLQSFKFYRTIHFWVAKVRARRMRRVSVGWMQQMLLYFEYKRD